LPQEESKNIEDTLKSNGTLTFENGDKYEGEIQDGKITGKGKRTSLTYIYEG
jgi:hypothetical protein